MDPLASRLVGLKIGKWNVVEKRVKTQDDNSGAFSSCYRVRSDDGVEGFMKVFNYAYAFGNSSPADTIHQLTGDFTYERDLVMFCRDNGLTRIVTAIDSGEYVVSGEPYSAPYLVFEIADESLKNHHLIAHPDLSWKLKMFHGALVALRQLHSRRIAHQDIKASNILIFNREVSKLSDLGRATQVGNESRHETGDMRFAPIELLYGYASPDWATRRYGADLFMMGGVLGFLVADTNFLGAILAKVPKPIHPLTFGGTYEQALPYLTAAHNEVVNDIEGALPDGPRKLISTLLRELCHPDPNQRGNPPDLSGSHTRFALERYISLADLASRKANR